jgi:hypothetical protein
MSNMIHSNSNEILTLELASLSEEQVIKIGSTASILKVVRNFKGLTTTKSTQISTWESNMNSLTFEDDFFSGNLIVNQLGNNSRRNVHVSEKMENIPAILRAVNHPYSMNNMLHDTNFMDAVLTAYKSILEMAVVAYDENAFSSLINRSTPYQATPVVVNFNDINVAINLFDNMKKMYRMLNNGVAVEGDDYCWVAIGDASKIFDNYYSDVQQKFERTNDGTDYVSSNARLFSTLAGKSYIILLRKSELCRYVPQSVIGGRVVDVVLPMKGELIKLNDFDNNYAQEFKIPSCYISNNSGNNSKPIVAEISLPNTMRQSYNLDSGFTFDPVQNQEVIEDDSQDQAELESINS